MTVVVTELLRGLGPEGRRMEDGLALQMHRPAGWVVLSLSRIGVPVREGEIVTAVQSVVQVYAPLQVWRSKVQVVEVGEIVHFVVRLMWPVDEFKLVYEAPQQEGFPF